jgi:hypothetical protein
MQPVCSGVAYVCFFKPAFVSPGYFTKQQYYFQEILLRLQQDTNLPYHFAEGTLYLDPDIIDLTMIPPPITPDNVNWCVF